MITTCPSCQTRYQLDDQKVPRRLIRVRCPGCKAVFRLDGTKAGESIPETSDSLVLDRAQDGLNFSGKGSRPARKGKGILSPAAAPDTTPKAVRIPAGEPVPKTGATVPKVGPSQPQGASSPQSVAPVATSTLEPSQAVPEPQVDSAPVVKPAEAKGHRRKRDKTHMLARALVSDILVYNREKRDKALRDGNLIEALGTEIKKSWEMYKDRVTPEVANSTTHFKDALNEILAEGKKIF